jgi:hypothetical protein
MKLLRLYSNLCLYTALILICIYLSGCLEFKSIEQPYSVRPGEMFTINIGVAIEFNEDGNYSPRLAVRLPDGWIIPGDSFVCTGIYDQEIVFDPNLVLGEEELSPSPEGYHWWIGVGNAVLGPLNGTAYAEIPIQTDEQGGLFSLDYTLGYDEDGVEDRSNNHPIEVVDEYTPRELRASFEGNTVSLSWSTPSEIKGLIGYNLYRNGQLANSESVSDTKYSDQDLPGGVYHYTVSSVYENSDEHVIPYEVEALVFSGGTGEPNAPYQITLAEQLVTIADFPDLLGKHFVLNNNIDLDPNLQEGRVLNRAVIPTFSGTFNGQGHVVQHLTIEEGELTKDRLGLFGDLESGGRVWNLGITDVNISGSGSDAVAGLVGENSGELNSCYVTGKIMADNVVGGLVGKNDPNGQIEYCYSNGFVSGEYPIGGLVGSNEGSIVSCYSTCTITGRTSLGGLVGDNRGIVVSSYSTGPVNGISVYGGVAGGLIGPNSGSVYASFWDIQNSGQTVSGGGAGLTTDEMMDPFMVGLNGLADNLNWVLDAGNDYPRLAWEGTQGDIVPAADMGWLDGQGTTENPYRIDAAEQLVLLSKASILWDRHFLLGADINFNPVLRGGQIFEQAVIPVFSGVFDGANHVISDLRLEGTYSHLGLFGTLTSDAEVRNIGLVDVEIDVTEYWGTGGLVGINNGSIVSCYSTGTITGYDLPSALGGLVGHNLGSITMSFSTVTVKGSFEVGGLVGTNDGSIVSSYSSGSINGRDYIGGLVGENDGSIVSSYSNGSVAADKSPWASVGGLVGHNWGIISSSYSSGPVSGRSSVGGLVGSGVNNGTVEASFWDIQSSGQAASTGGAGLTTDEMMDPFMVGLNGLADDPNWVLDTGHDYPRLAWEGTPGTIVPAADMGWLNGEGTANSPYRIDTADQLILLSKAGILWDKHFLLGADIDLNPGLPGRQIFGQAVIPIFAGVFDGAGHVISNLRIEGTLNAGLFGTLTSYAEVRNVGVADAQISSRDEPTAGLVGNNHGSIVSCFSTGAIMLGARSEFSGDVRDVGGLAGRNDGNIIASFSTTTVGGIGHAGGLVGWNDGSIVSCYSTGAVSGSRVDRGDRSPVEGTSGGLVGWNFHRGDIHSSYSVGLVSGTNYVGGFVGENYGSIDASFWDNQSSDQTASAGGAGLTTSEMWMASTFLSVGWDFVDETANGTEDIWWINEGQDYPRLWWENVGN